MTVPAFAADEVLSPELVLVLPPELRAQVLARLPAPVWWPTRVPAVAPASVARSLVSRAAQLALVFVALTVITLVMTVVAQFLR